MTLEPFWPKHYRSERSSTSVYGVLRAVGPEVDECLARCLQRRFLVLPAGVGRLGTLMHNAWWSACQKQERIMVEVRLKRNGSSQVAWDCDSSVLYPEPMVPCDEFWAMFMNYWNRLPKEKQKRMRLTGDRSTIAIGGGTCGQFVMDNDDLEPLVWLLAALPAAEQLARETGTLEVMADALDP